MKGFLLFLVLSIGCNNYAQTYFLNFDFDVAGNQTVRSIQLDCPSCKQRSSIEENVIEEKVVQAAGHEIIFYPNPVQEELNIRWVENIEFEVTSIEVYSLAGQQLLKKENLDEENSTVLPFKNMSSGTYIASVLYVSGAKKDVKIIKK